VRLSQRAAGLHTQGRQVNVEKRSNWDQLVDALVEIRLEGRVIRTGFVDAAMPDSSHVWIAADGVSGRQLFDAADGYEVWVTPQQLTGHRRYRMVAAQIFSSSDVHLQRALGQ
jgi:hypothetical protein